jgi:glyoxylase I family protein
MHILGLDHLVIRARSPEILKEFYCGVLGCILERELPDDGLVQLRAGSALIDLIAVDSRLGRLGGAAPGTDGHNIDHFCLRVEPFEEAAIRELLESAGVAHEPASRRYGADGFGFSIYLKDPEGNMVELKGPPETGPTV